MKFLLLLGILFMTACSPSNDSTIFYNFNEIEHAHELEQEPMEQIPSIQLELDEDGKVTSHDNIEDLILNVKVTNTTSEILEIGSHVDIERYDSNSWEIVTPPENLTEEAVLIQFSPNETIEYTLSINERFLESDELKGGTYRLNNNNEYFAYFFIAEFSNKIE